jgi:hypothetical protein
MADEMLIRNAHKEMKDLTFNFASHNCSLQNIAFKKHIKMI